MPDRTVYRGESGSLTGTPHGRWPGIGHVRAQAAKTSVAMGQPQRRRGELLMRLQRQLDRLICGRSARPKPPVVIVNADDIVLTKVVAVLDLNEH